MALSGRISLPKLSWGTAALKTSPVALSMQGKNQKQTTKKPPPKPRKKREGEGKKKKNTPNPLL